MAPFSVYAFDELDKLCAQRREAGVDVIDFGVGDPTDPTPRAVVEAGQAALESHRCSGYPSYIGSPAFRGASAAFMERRFGVTLDPATEITATIGSKEAVFHLPQAFVDPGRIVLVPTPGYPPYSAGTAFAGGRVATYPVAAEGPLLPDLDGLPPGVADEIAVVWITQPHVPTGRSASVDALGRLADQCRHRGILLCSDEAYSELWYDEPPASALQVGRENVLVFQSLSKQAAMTGYRIGFVAGDAQATVTFRRLKTQVDSGAPAFVQDAAIAALADPSLAARSRERYAARAEILIPALRALGCDVDMPEAGLYLWARTPERDGTAMSGVDFARELLTGPAAMAVLPGEWLVDDEEAAVPAPGNGDERASGRASPGACRVRLALVPDEERCVEAAARLASC